MVNTAFAQELERVVGRDRILRDPNELIPFELAKDGKTIPAGAKAVPYNYDTQVIAAE